MKPRTTLAAPLLVLMTGCSLLLDLKSFPEDAGNASARVDGGATGADGGGGQGDAGAATPDAGASACDCVARPPSGWAYVRLAEEKDFTGPTCPSEATASEVMGTGAVDTGCGACTCGAATPTCNVRITRFWYDCNGTLNNEVDTSFAGCMLTGSKGLGGTQAFRARAVPAGSCSPNVAPNAARFEATATVCTLLPQSESSCTTGECIPRLAPPFEPSLCILRQADTDETCPPDFPFKRAYATSLVDNRSCTGCSCSAAQGVTCSGGTLTKCNSTSSPNAFEACLILDATNDDIVVETTLPVASGGHCDPVGTPTVTGSVSTTGVHTVCCAN